MSRHGHGSAEAIERQRRRPHRQEALSLVRGATYAAPVGRAEAERESTPAPRSTEAPGRTYPEAAVSALVGHLGLVPGQHVVNVRS